MRTSRSGLVVAAAYVVLSAACIAYGDSLPNPKDAAVLMQVPVLPALLILNLFGLVESLAVLPLVLGAGLLVALTAAMLYAACWLFGALGRPIKVMIGVGALIVLAVALFWPARP